jgi:prepilin-type N-terminal cleavage/methylation domain-containing protein/prepilin-type processing-associated H-X9-DG protein
MSRQKRGFTLIELLVVIAVIATLAAILFPVFARARAKSCQAVCLSNVKQLGYGCMMYVQDYDESFPFIFRDSEYDGINCRSWTPPGGWWVNSVGPKGPYCEVMALQFLGPYVSQGWSPSIYLCPNGSRDGRYLGVGIYAAGLKAYGVNSMVWSRPPHWGLVVRTLAQLEAPAEIIAICESGWAYAGWGQQNSVNHPSEPWYLPGTAAAVGIDCSQTRPLPMQGVYCQDYRGGRHPSGVVAAFADGHARLLPAGTALQRQHWMPPGIAGDPKDGTYGLPDP